MEQVTTSHPQLSLNGSASIFAERRDNLSRNWPTNTAFDVDAFLIANLGPRQLPLNWLIPLTTVYGIIFLSGLVGNVCTCLVIGRNQYMQTATNCYLFNLAVADMLTLLCAMPLELYTLWNQYPWHLGNVVCELRAIIPEATAYASILTIVTFSTERYIAICHPIRQQTKSKLSRAIRNIVIIWILSLVGATPYGIFTRVNYLTDVQGKSIQKSAWCGFPFNDPDRSWETLMLCSTFLFFVGPMTIIIVLYVRIAMTLHRSRHIQRGMSESRSTCRTDSDRYKVQSRRIVVRMLIAVVVAFFVCWAPFHAQRLLFLYVTLYGDWTDALRRLNQDLFSLAGCFYYFNSTINPILYSVMSNRFRVAFREKLCTGPIGLWCCCCCCYNIPEEEKRTSQRISVYRNSHSQSSVRSQTNSHPLNNTLLTKNNSCPRLRAYGMGHSDSFPANLTWTRNPYYCAVNIEAVHDRRNGGTLSVQGPQHASEPNFIFHPSTVKKNNNQNVLCNATVTKKVENEDVLEVSQELDNAIRPEIARLSERDAGCVNCTNCNLLFAPKGHKLQMYSPINVSQVSSDNNSSKMTEVIAEASF